MFSEQMERDVAGIKHVKFVNTDWVGGEKGKVMIDIQIEDVVTLTYPCDKSLNFCVTAIVSSFLGLCFGQATCVRSRLAIPF